MGASLRTQGIAPGVWVISWSQSPQIGASLRTQKRRNRRPKWDVSIPSNRGKPSDNKRAGASQPTHPVSIPSNRGKPSDLGPLFINRRQVVVSIPSNRGKPSDLSQPQSRETPEVSLNPLKSGQAFGPICMAQLKASWEESQSPQIGASLRTQAIA